MSKWGKVAQDRSRRRTEPWLTLSLGLPSLRLDPLNLGPRIWFRWAKPCADGGWGLLIPEVSKPYVESTMTYIPVTAALSPFL